jgi:hypothetical protein
MGDGLVGESLWDRLVCAGADDEALPALPLVALPKPPPVAPSSSSSSTSRTVWSTVLAMVGDDSVGFDDVDGVGGGQAASAGVSAIAAPGAIAIGDDEDDDVLVVLDRDVPGAGLAPDLAALYAASPLDYWIGQIGESMETAVRDVAGMGGKVCWQLPPTLGQDIVMWALAHIRGALAQGEVHSFYIGLTSLVFYRWWGRRDCDLRRGPLLFDTVMVGHCRKWHRMTILAVSDDAGEISRAEESCIEQFRTRGPTGRSLGARVVNGLRVVGDYRCENKRPGQEGGFAGVPPHLLYVCMRWIEPTHRCLRMRRE